MRKLSRILEEFNPGLGNRQFPMGKSDAAIDKLT